MSVVPTVSVVIVILAQAAVGLVITNICGEPECLTNQDCPNSTVCWQERCFDPCVFSVCGQNTICSVTNHMAVCTCQTGFTGDPLTGCQPLDVPECDTNKPCPSDRTCVRERCLDPCQFIVCGQNTLCHAANHTASCICPQGHAWNSFKGCQQASAVESRTPLTPGLPTSVKNKKEYLIYTNIQMNWFQALALCHTLGMRMATIDNKAEYDQFVAAVKDAKIGQIDIWLGGANLGQDNVYIWMSTGKPVRYFNWNAGEPNHMNRGGVLEHCLMLGWGWGYKYNDQTCTFQHYAACEF